MCILTITHLEVSKHPQQKQATNFSQLLTHTHMSCAVFIASCWHPKLYPSSCHKPIRRSSFFTNNRSHWEDAVSATDSILIYTTTIVTNVICQTADSKVNIATGYRGGSWFWVSPSGLFSQVSSPKPCIHLSSPPYMLHVPPISFFSILSPEKCW